jgi:hypothetical protein
MQREKYRSNGIYEPESYFSGLNKRIKANLTAGLFLVIIFSLIELISYLISGELIFLN